MHIAPADVAAEAHLGGVARAAADGLISDDMIRRCYKDGGGGGGGKDPGDRTSDDESDADVSRPQMKKRRIDNTHSALSSSSLLNASVVSDVSVAVHTVAARKTVVDSVEECIQSIRHAIQDDPKACRKIDEEMTDSALGFWSKFNVNVNGNDAPTPSLRQSVAVSSDSASSSAVSVGHNSAVKKREELEKAVNQFQNRLTKIREEMLLDELILKAADKAEAVLLANCGWEGARLMHHIKPMEKALTLTDFQYRSAMRHKYGLPPVSAADHVWNC